MSTYLITGSSKGIGLALAQHLLAHHDVGLVLAAARSQSSGITALIETHPGKVLFVELDVSDEKSIKTASNTVKGLLKGKGLDFLINNAGVQTYTPGGTASMADLESTFKVNVAGPHYLTNALLPTMRRSNRKVVVNISSTLGSLEMAGVFAAAPLPGYKISKTALNMLTVQYALDYGKEDFIFICLSPGHVKTDLTAGQNADLDPEQSANAVFDIIHGAKKEDNGKFFNVEVAGWERRGPAQRYDGSIIPW